MTQPDPRPPCPTFTAATLHVAWLTARRCVRGPRLLLALSAAALPLLLSGLSVWVADATAQQQAKIVYPALSYLHFGLVLPVVAMVFATTFPWPEADEGTLTWWFTGSVRRSAVLLGRFLGHTLVGCLVIPLSVASVCLPLDLPPEAELGRTAADAVTISLVAFPVYLALFGLATTWLRQGLVLAIVFLVLENSLYLFQGAIQRLTVIFYVRCLLAAEVPAPMQRHVGDTLLVHESVAPATAWWMLAGVGLATLVGSMLVVELTEYRARKATA